MFVSAIIAAGGAGRRLGAPVPKQLLEIGGRSMLDRSLAPFLASDLIDEIIVVLPHVVAESWPPRRGAIGKPMQVVTGGPSRQESVANGFDRTSAGADLIVVHDAARPFVTRELIARTVEAAREAGAALAALPASDTVKQVGSQDGAATAWVVRTLDRASIYLAQTPQAFRREVMRDAVALGRTGAEATDEAALAELAGHPVRVVPGDAQNIKITTETDLAFARGLAGGKQPGACVRVGSGYDLHRLVEGRPLVLGGVSIPHDRGLAGHSDADAVCHAVTDAILGAVAAGDIGRYFPDSDERWRGAASIDLLRRAVTIVEGRGFSVANVDVVIIAERPRIGPYVDEMRRVIADALAIETADISIKGKTNEGVGEIGRGDAIAVHAVALVAKRS